MALDTEQPLIPGSTEYAWLDADLARARADGRFIVPYFHTAIFSIADASSTTRAASVAETSAGSKRAEYSLIALRNSDNLIPGS